MHYLRCQDAQVSRRLQRDALHSIHKLHDHHPVAGLRTPLPRIHEQRHPRGHPGPVPVPQRFRSARLSLLSQGLHRPDETREEHQGTSDGPSS